MTVLGTHPARLDLTVHPGDPVDFTVPVLDAAGVAVDLSGWTLAVTATGPDGQVLHSFTPTVDGGVRAAADSAVTAAWAWAPYAARLTVTGTPPAGGPVPIAAGWIRLYRP